MLRKLFAVSAVLIALCAVTGEAQASTCTILTTNLRSGSSDLLTGNQVFSLIRFLQEEGYVPASTVVTSGKMTFGPITLAGLQKYQTAQKLVPTGVANIATRFRIFLNSCYTNGTAVIPSTAWQAGASRAITWNKNLIRSSYIEIALKKTDTAVRYILTSFTLNDGADTVILPSSLPSGTYSMEARFALSFGGKYFALGYPVTLAKSITVQSSSHRGGGGGGGSSSGGSDTSSTYSFDELSMSSSLMSGDTSSLEMSGTNIDHYNVSFDCGSSGGAYVYPPSSTKDYCQSLRTLYRYGTISVSGSDTSLSFTVKNSNAVSKTVTVTVNAYKSDNTLVGSRSATITVLPVSGSASFDSLSLPSSITSGSTGYLYAYGTNIDHYNISFACGVFGGAYIFNPSTNENYCSSLRTTFGLGTISVSGSDTSLSFLVYNANTVSKTVAVTVSAYKPDGTLVGNRSATITVNPDLITGTGSSGDSSPTFTSFTASSSELSSDTMQTFSYSFTKLDHMVLSFSCPSTIVMGTPNSLGGYYSCSSITITPASGVTSGSISRIFSNTGSESSLVTATLSAYNSSGGSVGTKTISFIVIPPPASANPEMSQ